MFNLIGYYLYYPFFLISKLSILGLKVNLHTRHSYYFKKILFLVSDIDLTIYTNEQENPEQLVSAHNRYRILKKVFPILGEVNFWNLKMLKQLVPILNIYELKRDPLLLNLLNETKSNNDDEKILYIIKLLRGDLKNLRNSPRRRLGKYQYCFEVLNPLTQLKSDDLNSVEHLVDYISVEIFESKYEGLLRKIQNLVKNNESEDLELNAIWNVDYDYFEKTYDQLKHKELVIKTLHWEIVGCVTQAPIKKADFNLIRHLTRTTDLIKKIDPLNEANYLSLYDEVLNYILEFKNI